MAIRPVKFNANATVDLWHDEEGHGGTVALSTLQFGRFAGAASVDQRYLTIVCPVAGCGSASTHPIGGGAAPREVQQAIIRALLASTLPGVPRTWAGLKPLVRALAVRMGGTDAWLWENDDPTS